MGRLHALRRPDPRSGGLRDGVFGCTILVAVAYSAGSAAVLLVLSLGGRRLMERVRGAGRGPALQRVLGMIMIVTGLVIATNLDLTFTKFVAKDIPNVNLTASLERSSTVTERLHSSSLGTSRSSSPPMARKPVKAPPRRTTQRRPTPLRQRCWLTRNPLNTWAQRRNSTKPRLGLSTPGGNRDALHLARQGGSGGLLDIYLHQSRIRTLPHLEAGMPPTARTAS